MTKSPGVAAKVDDALKVITPARVELAFKVMGSVGLTMVTYAYLMSAARSWEATKKGIMEGKWIKSAIGSTFSIGPYLAGAMDINNLIRDSMVIVAPRIVDNGKMIQLYEGQREKARVDRDAALDSARINYNKQVAAAKTEAQREQALKNYETMVKSIISTYESKLAPINKALAEYQDKYDKNKKAMDEMLTIREILHVGISLLAGGGGFWLMSHPEVVKEIIDSTEKITVKAIDETSEVIDKTGEALKDIIESVYPWKGIF